MERLREETLGTACARYHQLVLVGKLVDTEDGDDILKLVVLLEELLDGLGGVVVVLADDVGVKDSRGRLQGVYGRVDTQLRNLTRKHRGSVKE